MSAVLASSRFPVPNVLAPFMGDYGTLCIRVGVKWYVWTGVEWHPKSEGLTPTQFWKMNNVRPPLNVEDGWAGIFHGGAHPQNWTIKDVRGAFAEFIRQHRHEYQAPTGQCFDPFKKGMLLGRIANQRAAEPQPVVVPSTLSKRGQEIRDRVEREKLIHTAPAPRMAVKV